MIFQFLHSQRESPVYGYTTKYRKCRRELKCYSISAHKKYWEFNKYISLGTFNIESKCKSKIRYKNR